MQPNNGMQLWSVFESTEFFGSAEISDNRDNFYILEQLALAKQKVVGVRRDKQQ